MSKQLCIMDVHINVMLSNYISVYNVYDHHFDHKTHKCIIASNLHRLSWTEMQNIKEATGRGLDNIAR